MARNDVTRCVSGAARIPRAFRRRPGIAMLKAVHPSSGSGLGRPARTGARAPFLVRPARSGQPVRRARHPRAASQPRPPVPAQKTRAGRDHPRFEHGLHRRLRGQCRACRRIQSELGASVAAIQWVVDAYLLFLGALVLVGGSLGDKLGRRTVFIAGIGLFTLASIGCGLAPGAARADRGARRARRRRGAAGAEQPVDHRRGVRRQGARPAIGTWAGVGAITSALGPVAGGWLVDAFSWRAIFFLNVPLACATVALASWPCRTAAGRAGIVRRAADHRTCAGRLDWPGAATATAGLAALTYGLTAAPRRAASATAGCWRRSSAACSC